MATGPGRVESRNLVLLAMIFAVSMTFIDQTIVAIAAPKIQSELGLSASGVQWAINAYLLALAAFFAFGGRLADTVGHRRMVVIGVIIFAGSSALCGLTPKGSIAEAWIVAFRALQGIGGAFMFPAALAIVVQTFELRERGRALALFFGVAGGLTAIGPIAGGYLTEWTWRSIFWINIPVAIISLVLVRLARPVTAYRAAPIDWRGLVLIAFGVGLSIFGFQQASLWGWSNPGIYLCIAAGVMLLIAFVLVELRTESPLIQVRIFQIRPFAVENIVLGAAMMAFIPLFFYASEYAEIGLARPAFKASQVLLYFFLGFVVAAQVGGRLLDRRGAKLPVLAGSAIAAVGYILWANKMPQLNLSNQVSDVIIAGAGMGLMLGPANTDAVNRASRLSYGEATGITQTVRNYFASLGFAILGTILITDLRNRLTDSLISQGHPADQAKAVASTISQSASGGSTSGGSNSVAAIPHFVRLDFAYACRTVFLIMGGVMAFVALVALVGLQRGVQLEPGTEVAAADREPSGAPSWQHQRAE